MRACEFLLLEQVLIGKCSWPQRIGSLLHDSNRRFGRREIKLGLEQVFVACGSFLGVVDLEPGWLGTQHLSRYVVFEDVRRVTLSLRIQSCILQVRLGLSVDALRSGFVRPFLDEFLLLPTFQLHHLVFGAFFELGRDLLKQTVWLLVASQDLPDCLLLLLDVLEGRDCHDLLVSESVVQVVVAYAQLLLPQRTRGVHNLLVLVFPHFVHFDGRERNRSRLLGRGFQFLAFAHIHLQLFVALPEFDQVLLNLVLVDVVILLIDHVSGDFAVNVLILSVVIEGGHLGRYEAVLHVSAAVALRLLHAVECLRELAVRIGDLRVGGIPAIHQIPKILRSLRLIRRLERVSLAVQVVVFQKFFAVGLDFLVVQR